MTTLTRRVVEVGQRSTSALLRKSATRHEWVLLLSCGHIEYRYAGNAWQKPAPKYAKCKSCSQS